VKAAPVDGVGFAADILGGRATDFEKKQKKGKEASLLKLKYEASELGVNAVIGVDLFSPNRNLV
jgi:uncharacterized protein YbjQ (UPF0145 family)